MGKILISYRRADSPGMTLAIFHRLEAHYGKGSVFIDIDNIPVGTDFRDHLNAILHDCDVVLAIVGRKWLGGGKRGQLRIKDVSDWVRMEIETALQRDIPIIPVLVDGAAMPQQGQLPDSLDAFRFRQAARVDHGESFFAHMSRLMHQLDQLLEGRRPENERVPGWPEHADDRSPDTPAPPPSSDAETKINKLEASAAAPAPFASATSSDQVDRSAPANDIEKIAARAGMEQQDLLKEATPAGRSYPLEGDRARSKVPVEITITTERAYSSTVHDRDVREADVGSWRPSRRHFVAGGLAAGVIGAAALWAGGRNTRLIKGVWEAQ